MGALGLLLHRETVVYHMGIGDGKLRLLTLACGWNVTAATKLIPGVEDFAWRKEAYRLGEATAS
jgi:hypothetical protein